MKTSSNRKIFSLIYLTIFVLSSLSLPLQTKGCAPAPEDCYEVVFNGRTIDGDTSTWSYTVTELGGCGCKDISHWVWQPCYSENEIGSYYISADPTPEKPEGGDFSDPSTGHYGVKWELDDSFVSGTFTVTIQGQPSVDDTGGFISYKSWTYSF